jgi:hypothetical protein
LESLGSFLGSAVRQCAHELVTSHSDHRVVGANVRIDRGDNISYHRVAGGMALTVVDVLELIDVDEGEHEPSVAVSSAADFMLKRDHSQSAAKRAGERVKFSMLELLSRLVTITPRGRPIPCGLPAVNRRPGSIGARACPDRGRIISFALSRHTLATVEVCRVDVALLGRPITRARAEITQMGGLVTPQGSVQPLGSRQRAHPAHENALKRPLQSISPRRLIHLICIGRSTRRLLAVSNSLVSIRGPPIHLRRNTVPIRRCLISIRSRLLKSRSRFFPGRRLGQYLPSVFGLSRAAAFSLDPPFLSGCRPSPRFK